MTFIPVRKYNSDQIILNSGRLIFNAKEDNILISSKKDVSITSAGAFHVNIGPSNGASANNNYFIVNAPKIQFGLSQPQPVTKGDDLADLLNKLLDALADLASNLTSATGIGVGTIAEPTINAAGTKLQSQIQNIASKVDSIKSTVTFTS